MRIVYVKEDPSPIILFYAIYAYVKYTGIATIRKSISVFG